MMRRGLILVPVGLLLVGGGIAVGRYLVPESSSGAAQQAGSVTTTTEPPPTTTSTSASTTTTTTAPQGPTPGIYDIAGSTPTSPHLFLVVQQVKPTALLPTGGVNIDVTFQSGDGSTQSVDQLIGTASAGHMTLTSQTNPGEGKYQGSQDGKVSGSYGSFQGVTSIFFGGGMCGKWGGPIGIQACNFTLRAG